MNIEAFVEKYTVVVLVRCLLVTGVIVLLLLLSSCAQWQPKVPTSQEVRVLRIEETDFYRCGKRGRTLFENLESRERFFECDVWGEPGEVFNLKNRGTQS